jgi:hypothetical protein
MTLPDSGSPILAAGLGLWLVLLAALPVVCEPWLNRSGLIALIILEASLSLALLAVKVRTRKTQRERRQMLAMRAAIQRGILY